MYSVILSHANSNETSFAGLEHVAIAQPRVRRSFVSVHTHAALVDQPARLAAALGESRLDQSCHKVGRRLGDKVGDAFRYLPLSKLDVEISHRRLGSILAVQA